MITLKGLILASLVLVLWIPAVPSLNSQGTRSCGEWRWDIKTLSDVGAKKVTKAEWTTIEWLVNQKSPIKGKVAPRYRLSPLEYKTFTVEALVVGYKLEADRNFHLVIADPKNPGITMIAEIPDPLCDGAKTSGHMEEFQAARSALIHMLGPVQRGQFKSGNNVWVKITGVGFFDKITGESGAAANGIELHPVLLIQK